MATAQTDYTQKPITREQYAQRGGLNSYEEYLSNWNMNQGTVGVTNEPTGVGAVAAKAAQLLTQAPTSPMVDTGVQGEVSFTNWKKANPTGTYSQWKATLPGGDLKQSVTGQYNAAQQASNQLAGEVGSIGEAGPTPQQQTMISAIQQFNENFGRQMGVNVAQSGQEAQKQLSETAGKAETAPAGAPTPAAAPTATPTAAPTAEATAEPVKTSGQIISDWIKSFTVGSPTQDQDGLDPWTRMAAQLGTMTAAAMGITQQDYDNVKKALLDKADVYNKATAASMAYVQANADKFGDLVSNQYEDQKKLNELEREEASLSYDQAITSQTQKNARYLGYLKGKFEAMGMSDSSAGLELMGMQMQQAETDLQNLVSKRDAAMRVYSQKGRELLSEYALNCYKIESDANEKIMNLHTQNMRDIAGINADIVTSDVEKNKQIISIMSDAMKSKMSIEGQRSDEVYRQAQLALDKDKYNHLITMDAANLKKQDLDMVKTISEMNISAEQKNALLKQFAPDFYETSGKSNMQSIGTGDNCVLFARKYVPNLPFGLFTKQDKMNAVNLVGSRDLSKIQIGDALLTSEGEYGHVAVVTSVNGDKITVKEANYRAGQITEGRILDKGDSSILGFVSPTNPYAQLNSQVSTNMNEGINPAIEEEHGFFTGEESSLEQPEVDPTSQSILAQTGLGMNAFYWITGQGTKLSRDAETRKAAAKEAQEWANEKGIDVSTLPSQYEAINKVLASNISRMNKSRIMEQEIVGTIDNLQDVVNDYDLSKLNVENLTKVWAGQEINDPLAQQYAMHLYQLRQELAGYANALSGSTTEITVNDEKQAELIIRNGISTGSLGGLRKAVENSTSKMGRVLEGSVESAERQVWDLFGVGANFKSTAKDPYSQYRSQIGDGEKLVERNGKIGVVPENEVLQTDKIL